MKKCIEYFVNQSFTVNLISLFIIFAGLLALSSMDRDLHPAFRFQQIQVNVSLPGASAEEVEKYVTFPIEEVLNNLAGVDYMDSYTSNGYLSLRLVYKSSYEEVDKDVELVRSRIDGIRHELPQEIRDINVARDESNDAFLFVAAIQNFDEASSEHRAIFQHLKKDFLEIPGVVEVRNWLRARNIHIEFLPEKLKHYEISMTEARDRVKSALAYTPLGKIERNENSFSIEMANGDNSVERLSNIPVSGNHESRIILIKDIAKVSYQLPEKRSLYHFNGKDSVVIVGRKDLHSDAIELKEAISATVAEFNSRGPGGLQMTVFVDGPQFIEQQINVLKKNGIIGLILVLSLLILFLNWRTATMTALGVPIAYFGTLAVLHVYGIDIDLLSIIGLILVLGILVDDAIIISERYVENLENGLSPRDAATKAAKDLMLPVTGAILTTAVAFSPMLFIKSELTTVLIAVPLIVIFALLFSWIESFFILPNHLAHFVKKPPQGKKKYFNRLKAFYEKQLERTLRFRYPIVFAMLIMLGGMGYIAAKKLNHDFQLRINSERISVYASLKESASLEESQKELKPIMDYLNQLPKDKVENVAISIGSVWANGESKTGYRYAKANIYLDRYNPYPTDLKREIKQQVEDFIKTMPADKFESLYVDIEQEDNDESKKQMVSVRITGEEDVNILDIEASLKEVAEPLSEISEMVERPNRFQETWKFQPNDIRLLEYNLSAYEISRQIRGVFIPDQLTQIRDAGESIYVNTELAGSENVSFEDLNDLMVVTRIGSTVPLSYLGQWQKTETLKSIHHRDGVREFHVDFKINEEGSNVGAAQVALKKAIEPLAKQYPTYTMKVVDADEQAAKNKNWALKVAALCVFLVLMVIALILGSMTQAVLVGMPIPFGIIGIIGALYLHGEPLGVMALIGLVGTIGVAVNASLVMMDQINKNANSKLLIDRASITTGASSRLRAIILSTLTTLGGVIPMGYGLGGESGFTQPLAFSMAWGLSFATLMTLFLLPALVEIRNDLFKVGMRVLTKLGLYQEITTVGIRGPLPQHNWPDEEHEESDLFDAEDEWQMPPAKDRSPEKPSRLEH